MPMNDLGWDEDGMCDDHGAFACKRCARRSAEPKAPADVSGLVEDLRCVGTWIDHLGLEHTQDSINTIDQAADALDARDAEIELLKGVAEKAMDAAMANARDEYRALYSTTIASLKQEIAEAREVIENIADQAENAMRAEGGEGFWAVTDARAFLARQETQPARGEQS